MKAFILFLGVLFLSSCTGKLDFDQANQLDIHPVIEGDILYFDLNASNLTDQNGQFKSVFRDTVSFDIFKEGKMRDGFEKAAIEVAYKNTFNRHFATTYYFIDQQNHPVASEQFDINKANLNHPEVTGNRLFTFDKNANPDFVNFRKIVLEISVSPDNLPVEDKTLHVQTKGTFYMHTTLE